MKHKLFLTTILVVLIIALVGVWVNKNQSDINLHNSFPLSVVQNPKDFKIISKQLEDVAKNKKIISKTQSTIKSKREEQFGYISTQTPLEEQKNIELILQNDGTKFESTDKAGIILISGASVNGYINIEIYKELNGSRVLLTARNK